MFQERKEALGDSGTNTSKPPVENRVMANFRRMVEKNPLVAKLRKPGTVVMAELIPPKTHEIAFRPIHPHGKHEAIVNGKLIAICLASNSVRLHHEKEGLNKIFSQKELIHLVENGQTHRIRLRFSEKKEVSVCREDLQQFLVKAGLLYWSHATV
jgi:hypothetical protein